MFKDMFGHCRYKVGLHLHTTLSDGRCTPKEAAAIYKDADFDAVAFTDHWVYGEGGEIDGLTVLSGCEYNLGAADTISGVIHIVGVGMKAEPKIDRAEATRQGIVDAIKEQGGVAIWAHPAWSLNTLTDAQSLSGVDAVEIYNTVSAAGQSSRPYSGYFVDVLANQGIIFPLVATDDTHFYNDEDKTRSFIMVKATSASASDLTKALLCGDFYATQGPELHVRRDGDRIIVDCSSCVMINFLSNLSFARERKLRGENLIHGEYVIKPSEKWVRVELMDVNGNYAWSNVIEIL